MEGLKSFSKCRRACAVTAQAEEVAYVLPDTAWYCSRVTT